MPAEPWSVPAEAFSAPRRPNSDQTCIEHAVGDAARLEVALEREQRVRDELRSRLSDAAWRRVRVEVARP